MKGIRSVSIFIPFACGCIRSISKFISFACGNQSSTIYWRNYLCFTVFPLLLCLILVDYIYVGLFLGSPLNSIDQFIYSFTDTTLSYYNLIVYLEFVVYSYNDLNNHFQIILYHFTSSVPYDNKITNPKYLSPILWITIYIAYISTYN